MNFADYIQKIKTTDLKAVLRPAHSELERNPVLDWRRLLVMFFVFLVAVALIESIFFYKIIEGSIKLNIQPAAKAETNLNQATLETVEKKYETKRAQYENLRYRATTVADPSQ
jgi:hypothetical protein